MFKMEFELTNYAFRDGGREEVARILRQVADRTGEFMAGNILDVNGNSVGAWAMIFPDSPA